MTKREARMVCFRFLETHPLCAKEVGTRHGSWVLNWSGHAEDAAVLERELSDLLLGEFAIKLNHKFSIGQNYYTNHVTPEKCWNAYPQQLSDAHSLHRVPVSRRGRNA